MSIPKATHKWAKQSPQGNKVLRMSGNMSIHMRSLVIGFLVGAIASAILYRPSSSGKPSNITPKTDYGKIDWATIDVAKQSQSSKVSLQTRIWLEDGGCYLLEPKTSIAAWTSDGSPMASSPPAFRVTDESLHTRDWLMKSSNGGVCTVFGHLLRVPDGPSWLLGEIDRVDGVILNRGIDTSWLDLEKSASRYHEKVIRIAGRLGNHPQLSHLYLYRDEAALKARSQNQALMLGRTFVPHDDSHFSLLDTDGQAVVIEGVYQRPFRDDGEAPIGQLTILHRIAIEKQ